MRATYQRVKHKEVIGFVVGHLHHYVKECIECILQELETEKRMRQVFPIRNMETIPIL